MLNSHRSQLDETATQLLARETVSADELPDLELFEPPALACVGAPLLKESAQSVSGTDQRARV